MNNITNIEQLFELVNPALLTSKKSCYDMIAKAITNKNLINKYVKKVIKRAAELDNKKIFTQISRYNVDIQDYYIADAPQNIESCGDSLYNEVIDYGDGYDFEDFEEVKD